MSAHTHTRAHTHGACQRGGSLVPARPPSQPSSPSPPLQLHPGQQHQLPEQVTSPSCQRWVSRGRAVTHGRREGAPCWCGKLSRGGTGVAVGEVGKGCRLTSRVGASPYCPPGVPYPWCNGLRTGVSWPPPLSDPLLPFLCSCHADPSPGRATGSGRVSLPVIICIILGALLCLLLALLAGQVRIARAGRRGESFPRDPGVLWGVSEWYRKSRGDKSVCCLLSPVPPH